MVVPAPAKLTQLEYEEARQRIITHAAVWDLTLHKTPEGYTEDGCTGYRMAMHWCLSQLGVPR